MVIDAPIHFGHRGDEWAARANARRAVRYDISYDPDRDRWYLDASWHTDPEPGPDLADLRAGPVMGVDLNDGHLTVCVLDASGNPLGEPRTIEMATAGLAASRRDGRLRAAITTLLDHHPAHRLHRDCDREARFRRHARHRPRNAGPRQTRQAAAPHHRRHPDTPIRDRLIAMATRRGLAVIEVDPAYTSRWGNPHWTQPRTA